MSYFPGVTAFLPKVRLSNIVHRLIIRVLAVVAGLILGACAISHDAASGLPGNPTPQLSQAEPVVILSGVDHYWYVAAASVTEAAATVTVDTHQEFQTWHGLGGTFNEAGWQALSVLSEKDRERILTLLFDKSGGVGFEWGRIPIGASDYALSRYTLNDHPGDRDMSHFSVEHDRQWLIPYVQAAQTVSPDIKFWGSPWTPPAWMKTNKAFDKGVFDPDYYAPYAQYFVEWIKAYNREGIAIDHVQPQNEPGWSQSYPSCAWGPHIVDNELVENETVTLGDFVEHHLAPALEKAHLPTDIWYGTLSNNRTFDAYWDALSKQGRAKISGVGLQWGTRSRVPMLASTQGKQGQPLRVMQTEHMCGNYPWMRDTVDDPLAAHRGNFLASQAPNNHAYAEESWELLHDWIEQGVHIYSAWNMVLDKGGFNMDTERPWPQNALIAVDTDKRRYTVTPAYYVFRHIGQYVQPMARRVAITADSGLAFQNPDSSIVAIIYNAERTPKAVNLAMRGNTLSIEIPARGWATVYW